MTPIKATYLYMYTKTDTMGYYILYYTNTIDIVHIYTYIEDKLNNYYYTIPTPTLYTHTHIYTQYTCAYYMYSTYTHVYKHTVHIGTIVLDYARHEEITLLRWLLVENDKRGR